MDVAQRLKEKYYVFQDFIRTITKFKDAVMEFESIIQYSREKFD